jgi:hypothetical protein
MTQPGKSLAVLRWVMRRISNPRSISGQAIELYTVQKSAVANHFHFLCTGPGDMRFAQNHAF